MIVVTAPTGNIGHRVVTDLLWADASLRVIVRDADKLPDEVRSRVDVVEGSHGDRAVMDRALDGATALFWLLPPDPTARSVEEAYAGFTRPAAEAIRSHGELRVVDVTALGRGSDVQDQAGFVTGSFAMDDLLSRAAASFRAVTCPSFMDNLARQAVPIREKGMFFGPIDGDRQMPTCATRDIAATSARLLLDDSWTGVGHEAVLGPENLSFNEMATIMSDVLGRAIRYQQTSFEDYQAGFTGRGMSEAMAAGMTDMARAKNQGLDEHESRTDRNTTPTTFRQWCEEELKPALDAD